MSKVAKWGRMFSINGAKLTGNPIIGSKHDGNGGPYFVVSETRTAFSPNKTESKGKVEVHFRQISAELRTHSEVAYHYLQRKFGIMGLLVIRTSPLHHKLC